MMSGLAMAWGVMQGVESVSRVVANSFVSGIWEGIVLAAGVGICLRLVPKTTAAVRFAIWTAVFGVLAVLPQMDGVVVVWVRWSCSQDDPVSGKGSRF